MNIYDLPFINSILNSISSLLLLIGFILIKNGNRKAHQKVMWSAFAVSGLFMIFYLTFHFNVGSVKFTGEGFIRPLYFTILITHIILAMALVPLVIITLWRSVIKKDYSAHRKIARYTWPVWMYVSVTGVLIYVLMHFSGSYQILLN